MTNEILFPNEAEYLGTKQDIIIHHVKSVIDGKEKTLIEFGPMIPVFGKKKNKEN